MNDTDKNEVSRIADVHASIAFVGALILAIVLYLHSGFTIDRLQVRIEKLEQKVK